MSGIRHHNLLLHDLSHLNRVMLSSMKKIAQSARPLSHMVDANLFVLSTVPASWQASVLQRLLNSALVELIDNGELDFLEGRCCVIALTERNLSWPINFDGKKIRVLSNLPADVTVSASAADFLDLLSQRVDPDTLFFQRRLSIEGDVDMGLQVKNLLDALDDDDLPMIWRRALKGLKQLVIFEAAE